MTTRRVYRKQKIKKMSLIKRHLQVSKNTLNWRETSTVSVYYCATVCAGFVSWCQKHDIVRLIRLFLLMFYSVIASFITALHGMQTRSIDENSVRLSNAWIVTKLKKNLSRFLYHAKDHLS